MRKKVLLALVVFVLLVGMQTGPGLPEPANTTVQECPQCPPPPLPWPR